MRVLLTGSAGFIGFHTAKALLARGDRVFGYDNINGYYDPAFKRARLEVLAREPGFTFTKGDLADERTLKEAFAQSQPDCVVNLAAQAGVRYSLENPMAYIQSNVVGFQNLIDLVRAHRPANFVYASSSSVYGGNKVLPFSETQEVSNPISLYAATKLSNELVAKTYGNLFEIPSTGLRFFTVYGPMGRPDMAMFKFADLMVKGRRIPVFNHGKMIRDFTYIDDIVAGIAACVDRPEINQIYNLGKGSPDNLLDMIRLLEENLGMKAETEMMPMQAGDVEATLADISRAKARLGYQPKTDLAHGIAEFAKWYKTR